MIQFSAQDKLACESCAWLDIEELIQDAAEALQVLSVLYPGRL
jgi:hypothetical protein